MDIEDKDSNSWGLWDLVRIQITTHKELLKLMDAQERHMVELLVGDK